MIASGVGAKGSFLCGKEIDPATFPAFTGETQFETLVAFFAYSSMWGITAILTPSTFTMLASSYLLAWCPDFQMSHCFPPE